jgi:hypothetical protein
MLGDLTSSITPPMLKAVSRRTKCVRRYPRAFSTLSTPAMGARTLLYMWWLWPLVQSIVLQLILRESFTCGDAMKNHSVVTVRPKLHIPDIFIDALALTGRNESTIQPTFIAALSSFFVQVSSSNLRHNQEV